MVGPTTAPAAAASGQTVQSGTAQQSTKAAPKAKSAVSLPVHRVAATEVKPAVKTDAGKTDVKPQANAKMPADAKTTVDAKTPAVKPTVGATAATQPAAGTTAPKATN